MRQNGKRADMANKNSWQLTGSERIELVSMSQDESTGQEQDESVTFTYNPIVGFANMDQNKGKTQSAGPDESSFVKKRKKQLEYYKPKKNTKKNRRKYHKFDGEPDAYSGDAPDREDTRDDGKAERCCGWKAKACGLLVFLALIPLVYIVYHAYDLYYLLKCGTAKEEKDKCFKIHRVDVSEMCQKSVQMKATVYLDNPSTAHLHIGNVQGGIYQVGTDRHLGDFMSKPTFISDVTEQERDYLW